MRNIHLITLLSGRWQTFEPYLESLKALDYPRENLNVIWYTNADSNFCRFLQQRAGEIANMGFRVKLFQDQSVPVSENAMKENGQRPAEHAIVIAALYNNALNSIRKGNWGRVFFLEDDISCPSDTLIRHNNTLDRNPDAAYVTSVVFDRHSPEIFAWDYELVPKGYSNLEHETYRSKPPQRTWGVQDIGLSGLACTLIDFSRFPKAMKKPYFKPQVRLKAAEHFVGCDIVLCFTLGRHKVRRLMDWNIRTLHYDSTGKPH